MNTQPKRLERSRSDQMISGVCGGLAQYLNLDPALVRLVCAGIILFSGVGFIGYIIAWVVIPEEGRESIADKKFEHYPHTPTDKSPLDDIYGDRPGTNTENVRREYRPD